MKTKSKFPKRYLKGSKKRSLDLKSLESYRFGVISSAEVKFPSHPIKLSNAIQQLNQAGADLKRLCPQAAYGEVIIELPERCILKSVVPAIDQASLDTGHDTMHLDDASNDESKQAGQMDHLGSSRSIEETSLEEARRIAEVASKISMGAVDVGNQLIDLAEKCGLDLEDVVETLIESPDEKVSRSSYGRSGGRTQTIRYSALGERTLGGNHIVAADVLSNETYSLSGCKLMHGGRNGSFILEGQSDDPEWIRLSSAQPGEMHLLGDKNSCEMELLGYAAASDYSVDINVCLAEKIKNKRRWLKPLAIRNRPSIIARVRERMSLLEED